MIKVNVSAMKKEFERMTSYGKELRSFLRLDSGIQLLIITEMWERMFAHFWLTGRSAWVRDNSYAKKNATMTEEARLDVESLSTTMTLQSKDTYEKEAMPQPVSPDGYRPLYSLKKEKVPKATAKVEFSFNRKKMILQVEIVEVTAENENERKKYENTLRKELQTAADSMNAMFDLSEDFSYAEMRYAKRECIEKMLNAFFNTLHVSKECSCHIVGNEAVAMYRVYRNALEVYPDFAAERHEKQVEILDEGYVQARAYGKGSRDVHTFAMATFYALHRNGMVKRVRRLDPVFNKLRLYENVWENKNQQHGLIFIDFEYQCGPVRLRTAFKPFDLWQSVTETKPLRSAFN